MKKKLIRTSRSKKPPLAKEWKLLYESMFDEWDESRKQCDKFAEMLQEIRKVALSGYMSDGWVKVLEIINQTNIYPVRENRTEINIEQSPIELMRFHLKGHTFNGRPLTEYFENLVFINMNNDTTGNI